MNRKLFTDAIIDEIQSCSVIRKSASTVNLFFWKEWFEKSIGTIIDLLDKNGNVLPFPVLQSKYSLQKLPFSTITKLFLLF